MNILFLNPVANLGGAERSLIETLSILSKERPNWKISLITGTDGFLVTEAKSLGVNVEVFPIPIGLQKIGDSGFSGKGGLGRFFTKLLTLPYLTLILINYLLRFRTKIQEIKPDVVHSNGLKFHLILGLSCNPNYKCVWHARDFIQSRKLVGSLLKSVCQKPDLLVANSQAVANDWKIYFPKIESVVLYNSVNFPSYKHQFETNNKLFGTKNDSLVKVGLVGSFAKWKGHQLFLEAVRILTTEFPKDRAQFYIVGGPIYNTDGSQWTKIELEQIALSLGISNRVVFVPHQTDILPVYTGLDVIVHASTKPEPFGRTIIEGMSHCKAVVAAMAGGVVEIIEDGKDALGFESGNSVDLADKIGQVIRNPELRKKLGNAGILKVDKLFSRKAVQGQLIHLYEELMEEYS